MLPKRTTTTTTTTTTIPSRRRTSASDSESEYSDESESELASEISDIEPDIEPDMIGGAEDEDGAGDIDDADDEVETEPYSSGNSDGPDSVDDADDIDELDTTYDDIDSDTDEQKTDASCMYTFVGKTRDSQQVAKRRVRFDETEPIAVAFGETMNADEYDEDAVVPDDEKNTRPILFKYERVRVLGIRAQQIALNGETTLDVNASAGMSPFDIAVEELRQRCMPLFIIRLRSDGKKERWSVNELAVIN